MARNLEAMLQQAKEREEESSWAFPELVTSRDILKALMTSLLGRYSQHNAPRAGLMQKSFDNGQVLLMQSQNHSLEINREKEPIKSPKVILNRLNINEADNILISGDKIYIEEKEMTGSKTGRRDLVVKGGKTYVEHQDSHNGNFTAMDVSVESSLLYSKNKRQIKTHLNHAQNDSSDSCSKPLRQINGNVKPKSSIILSGVHSREMSNEPEIIDSWLPDQSIKCDPFYQSPDIQNQKNVWSNGILSRLVVKKTVKRLNSNPSPSLFSRFKSVFSSMNILNHSNPNSKSNEPFHNWGNDGMVKKYNCDIAKESGLENPRKFFSVSQRPKELQTSCKVTLERVDAKICFMGYLRLKPTVKTDERKMHELSLLRKYNIRNCHVVISRVSVEAKRKTGLVHS